jgi:phage virion morphogenesis protein
MPLSYDQAYESAKGVPLKAFLDIDWDSRPAQLLIERSFRVKQFDTLLRTIGRKMLISIRKNFMQSRTPEGRRWAPLKKTPRPRGHNRASNAPLFDSGKLYEDIQFVTDKDSVEIGFSHAAEYGRFHQEGARFIPARQFLGVRDGDLPDLKAALAEHIDLSFGGAR